MNKEKISIIVPVYKVEKYLEKCIASIVNQTYTELEIILVDDGSPDRCGEICDQWAKKDSRIKVVHKENGGRSDARNAGVEIATGEYIGFVDSDDLLEPDMYQVLFDKLMKYGADIAVCERQTVWEDESQKKQSQSNEFKILDGDAALKLLIGDGISQVVWNKLYRREVIGDIEFEVGKYYEDEFWSYQVFGRAKKVILMDYVGYYYRQHPGSIMAEYYSLRRLDVIEAKCRRQVYLEEKFPHMVFDGKKNMIFSCLYNGQLSQKYLKENKKEAMKFFKNAVRGNRMSKQELSQLAFTHRCWVRLAALSFEFACWLRNRAKIGV